MGLKFVNRNILCFVFGLALAAGGLYNLSASWAMVAVGAVLMGIAIFGARRPDGS